jgi:lantibiotic modifying enzyme
MAGILLTITILSEILGDCALLDIGTIISEKIFSAAEERDSLIVWPDNGIAYTGAAHGSAGISLSLLLFGQRTGSIALIDLSVSALKRLYRNRNISQNSIIHDVFDQNKVVAPVSSWCHGVEGYLWCMLFSPDYHFIFKEEIAWAVNTFKKIIPISNPTCCHGIAGQLEVWRMLGNIPEYRNIADLKAKKAAEALRLLHQKQNGNIVWHSEDYKIVTPDLWVGFLGTACSSCLYSTGIRQSIFSSAWLKKCSMPYITP